MDKRHKIKKETLPAFTQNYPCFSEIVRSAIYKIPHTAEQNGSDLPYQRPFVKFNVIFNIFSHTIMFYLFFLRNLFVVLCIKNGFATQTRFFVVFILSIASSPDCSKRLYNAILSCVLHFILQLLTQTSEFFFCLLYFSLSLIGSLRFFFCLLGFLF